MQKILPRREEPTWPPHCAACLEFPSEMITTSCTIITKTLPFIGFIPTAWHYASMQYPVCSRHAQLGQFKSFVARRNPFNLVMLTVAWVWLVLALVFFFSLLASYGPGADTRFFGYAAVLPIIMLLVRYWARHGVPVRIDSVDEAYVTLTFRNETYAGLFHEANKRICV